MQVMHGLRDEDNVESCQDEIDESLENLLIFPTHKGLKRCFDLSKCPRLRVSLSLAHCSNPLLYWTRKIATIQLKNTFVSRLN